MNLEYIKHRLAHIIRPVVDFESKLDGATFGGGRPVGIYLVGEIEQFMCSRKGCDRRAHAAWSGCADGNIQRPLCPECDVNINAIVLRWWGDPDAEHKITEYVTQVEADIGRAIDPESYELDWED